MPDAAVSSSLWRASPPTKAAASSSSHNNKPKPRRSPFSMSKGSHRAPWRVATHHQSQQPTPEASPPAPEGGRTSSTRSKHKGGRKASAAAFLTSPSSTAHHYNDDSRILRGAELVRRQIRRQFDESPVQDESSDPTQRPLLHKTKGGGGGGGAGSGNNSGKTGSFSSDDDDYLVGSPEETEIEALDDDFSDPWLDGGMPTPPGGRKMSDDSSTLFPNLPSGSLSGSLDEDGALPSGLFSDLSPILEHGGSDGGAQSSLSSPRRDPVSPQLSPSSPPPPPPPADESDWDDGYSPLSIILGKRPFGQHAQSHPRASTATLRSLRRQRGLLDEASGEESSQYGFVGDDYDSDLDQDDHFNSSNINSYLPHSLRGSGGGSGSGLGGAAGESGHATTSWSPATSAPSSGETSPPRQRTTLSIVRPRRLDRDAQFAGGANAAAEDDNNDDDEPNDDDDQDVDPSNTVAAATHVSPRTFLSFRKPGNSSGDGGKSKSPTASRSPKAPKQPRLPVVEPARPKNRTLQYISPTTSERTDRELYCPSHPPTLQSARHPTDLIPSPLSVEYHLLSHDPAYRHAQQAGLVWQSLVGQQVRFPSRWWNGARSPPLGVAEPDEVISHGGEPPKWVYLPAARVSNVRPLHRLIRKRSDPGRLLLHAVVLHRGCAVADFCVGLCHPNARGIRPGNDSNPQLETIRILWAAFRKRTVSCTLLDGTPTSEDGTSSGNGLASLQRCKTPLGAGRITNQNVRAVYGETPPLETVFVPQWELEQRLARSPDPLLGLVQEFVLD